VLEIKKKVEKGEYKIARRECLDYEWFLNTDLSEYEENEYVIIIDQKVVTRAKEDLKAVLSEIRNKYNEKTPLVAKVPSSETLIL
jgi:SepF-like predicted cell division protein (DUF552 family)